MHVPEKENWGQGEARGQTHRNTGYQPSAPCKLNLFLNDFIRKASIFYFVIHFPEATLDLADLLQFLSEWGKTGDRIMEISQVIQFFKNPVFWFFFFFGSDNFLNL